MKKNYKESDRTKRVYKPENMNNPCFTEYSL